MGAGAGGEPDRLAGELQRHPGMHWTWSLARKGTADGRRWWPATELCAGRDDQTTYEDLGVNAVTMAEIARL
jgi:hypothetical protein